MYKLKEYKDKIVSALTDLERRTIFKNKAGYFDLNTDAEEFYRGLLNLFYGWKLKNANTPKDPNYEGVDLLFMTDKVAVQVTSETTSQKVHDSIEGFKNKALQEGYQELYILMFQGKPDFPRVNFAKTVDKKFVFDKKKHIIDHSDLCKKLENAEFEYVKNIYEYLDDFGCIAYAGLDEDTDDLGIIDEIFEYIQLNRPKKASDLEKIKKATQINLIPKISLNFPMEEEQSQVKRLLRTVWDKKQVVDNFVADKTLEDEVSILELIYQIQEDFCQTRGTKNPNAKIEDIQIIRDLATNYLPDAKKRNPSYRANAQAFIFYFFEFCYIGDKTKEEKENPPLLQLSIFG